MSSGLTRTASSLHLGLARRVVPTGPASGTGLKRTASLSDVRVLNKETPLPQTSDTLETAKATIAAGKAFEKAKATTRYGFATIHYGLILPLKSWLVGLTDEQATDLDLYRKHTALCSGIETVQKAYKAYMAAQEAADKAPTNPVTAREGARSQAIVAGTALVTNYQNLIALAIDQAEEIGVGQTRYLNDLHDELEGGARALVLETIDQIRPKMDIEDGLLDDKASLGANLGTRYQKFVTEFVSNVQEARRQSGDSASLDAITAAFIQGLASIPELGELDKGLILIQLYDDLTNMQTTGAAEDQRFAIQHFKVRIEVLMNRPEPITTEDLQKIQYKGISLLSVMKSIDVNQLNELKTLRKELKDVQRQIKAAEAEIRQTQVFVAEQVPYTFADVQAFITQTGDLESAKALLKASKEDGTAFGRFAKSYTETLDKHAALTARVGEIQDRKAKAVAARAQVIADNEAAVAEAKAEIERLDQEIADETINLAAKRNELYAFTIEMEKTSKKLAGEKGSERMKKVRTAGFKRDCDDEMKTLRAEISQFEHALKSSQDDCAAQQDKLGALNMIVPELIKDAGSDDIKDAQTLHDLNEELRALQTKPMVTLSGEDIKVITERLRSGPSRSVETKIEQKWKQVWEAGVRVEKLRTQELPALLRWADTITKDMTNKSPLLTLNDEQVFVLDDFIFGDAGNAEIKTQLESNLVIAKKVTLEVGRKIDKQKYAVLQAKAAQDTKGPHTSNLVYEDWVSKLGMELDKREKADPNKDTLFQLVSKRVEKLPPVVSKKPVEARRPVEVAHGGEWSIETEDKKDDLSLEDFHQVSPDAAPSVISPLRDEVFDADTSNLAYEVEWRVESEDEEEFVLVDGGATSASLSVAPDADAVSTSAPTSAPAVVNGDAKGPLILTEEDAI